MSLKRQHAAAQGRLLEIGDELEAIGQVAESEGRDLTESDQQQMSALREEFDSVTERAASLKAAVETADKIAAARLPAEPAVETGLTVSQPQKLPAQLARIKSRHYASNYDAYCAGQWMRATFAKNPSAITFCKEHGVGHYKGAMETGTPELGGNAVPELMSATIIELVESWGRFRQYARNIMCPSGTQLVPKLNGSVTISYPGEGNAFTPSDLDIGQVKIEPIKYSALTVMSTELTEDAVINFVDTVTRDFARQFAYHEDLNGFLGDGTGTFGGMVGVKNALQAGAKVTQGSGAAADAWANITLKDYQAAIGKLKEFGGLTPVWFMSRYAYYNSVMDLLNTAGGTDMRQTEEGGRLMFLGAPVVITQVLPGETTAADDLLVVCGDLDLGAYLGMSRQVSIRTLTETYAVNDQLGVIGSLRSVPKIHDVGDATDAGSIVGIYAAAA